MEIVFINFFFKSNKTRSVCLTLCRHLDSFFYAKKYQHHTYEKSEEKKTKIMKV